MTPLNLQEAEAPEHHQDGLLDVVKVWPTLQGEGPLAGIPAVFVRLAGCNLTCPRCDTDYTTGRKVVDPTTLRLLVSQHAVGTPTHRRLVVLTGGEPFRQDVTPFVNLLLGYGYHIQVETNGCFYLQDFPYAHKNMTIVCSPKTAGINRKNDAHVAAWKYVLEGGQVDPDDGLPTSVLGNNVRVARPPVGTDPWKVFVQPMDAGDPLCNTLNTRAALASCERFGYRMSLQTHKILGLP